jgi:hypothetical protein
MAYCRGMVRFQRGGWGSLVMAVMALLTGCDDATLGGGGSGACPVIDNPAATLSGYQQFTPDQKAGDPRAQDPTYVYLVAGREAVVLTGPTTADDGQPFQLRNPTIALANPTDTSATGYHVTVDDHLSYLVDIDDFEFEIELARVEICQTSGQLRSHLVFRGAPLASGVAHSVITRPAIDGVAYFPTAPITVEVR